MVGRGWPLKLRLEPKSFCNQCGTFYINAAGGVLILKLNVASGLRDRRSWLAE